MNKGEKTCVYRFPLFSLYYKNRLSYIRRFKKILERNLLKWDLVFKKQKGKNQNQEFV